MTTSGNQSGESMSTMRDRAHNVAGKVVDKVQETATRMVGMEQDGDTSGNPDGERAMPIMDQAAEQVTSRLDAGKEYVVETMLGVAQALRKTGEHLREEDAQPTLAQYVDRGAEHVERFGGYLRQRDTGQLVADVEGFARRQPVVFAGGAFALGMLAVRFLRSGGQAQQPTAPMSASPSSGASSPGTGQWPTATPPRTYTGAAQDALHRAMGEQLAPPSRGGSASESPAGSGSGASTSGARPESPTPRPNATPSVGGTPSGSGSTSPTPASGGSAASSARPGASSRTQP